MGAIYSLSAIKSYTHSQPVRWLTLLNLNGDLMLVSFCSGLYGWSRATRWFPVGVLFWCLGRKRRHLYWVASINCMFINSVTSWCQSDGSYFLNFNNKTEAATYIYLLWEYWSLSIPDVSIIMNAYLLNISECAVVVSPICHHLSVKRDPSMSPHSSFIVTLSSPSLANLSASAFWSRLMWTTWRFSRVLISFR